jgi:hypothetical protein
MNLDQFIPAWNGKAALYNTKDPSLTGQCVQLVCFYNVQVLGIPVMWADAAYWYLNLSLPQLYKVSVDDLQRGDEVVWDTSLPNSDGSGHIAIFLQWTSSNTFISFDSNWGGKYAHQVTHNRNYILGGLRKVAPTQAAPTPQIQSTPQGGDEMINNATQAHQIYQMLRPNSDGSDAEINATAGRRTFAEFLNSAQPEVSARNQNLLDQATRLANLQSTIDQLNGAITNLQNLNSQEGLDATSKANQITALQFQIATLTTQLTTDHDQLAELQKQLQVPNLQSKSPNWFIKLLGAIVSTKKKP